MTDNEKLSCLIDRPCNACKFHKEEGCSKWSCVFEEKSDIPENTDLISRKEAIDNIKHGFDFDTVDGIKATTVLKQVISDLEKMPSAAPTDENRTDIEKIRAEIEALNPVDYGSMFSYESHNGARDMKDDCLDIIDKYLRGGKE